MIKTWYWVYSIERTHCFLLSKASTDTHTHASVATSIKWIRMRTLPQTLSQRLLGMCIHHQKSRVHSTRELHRRTLRPRTTADSPHLSAYGSYTQSQVRCRLWQCPRHSKSILRPFHPSRHFPQWLYGVDAACVRFEQHPRNVLNSLVYVSRLGYWGWGYDPIYIYTLRVSVWENSPRSIKKQHHMSLSVYVCVSAQVYRRRHSCH